MSGQKRYSAVRPMKGASDEIPFLASLFNSWYDIHRVSGTSVSRTARVYQEQLRNNR